MKTNLYLFKQIIIHGDVKLECRGALYASNCFNEINFYYISKGFGTLVMALKYFKRNDHSKILIALYYK